jgi:hypothetical protein
MAQSEDADHGLSVQLQAAIREEALKQAGKWTIGAFALLFGIAASGWWFYLQQKLDAYIAAKAGGVPPNAVIALDYQDGCSKLGDSWVSAGFDGHFIIGASKTDGGHFGYRDHQDNDSIKLTTENLPATYYPREHLFQATEKGSAFDSLLTATSTKPSDTNFVATGSADPTPIKTMPPYVALYFCRKKP